MSSFRSSAIGDGWIKAGFVATMIIFAVIAISAYVGMSAYLSNSRRASQFNDLHMKLYDLSLSLRDIQLGVRGYVITGDSAFLPPFRGGRLNVNRQFEELKKFLDPAGKQGERLEAIQPLVEKMITTEENEVELIQRGETDSAREVVRRGDANRPMEGIDDIIRIMQEEEGARMAKRQADAESEFSRSLVFLVLGTALNFVLIITMFVIINRQLRDRRAAAETLRQEEQRLKTVVNSVREGITYSNAGGGFEVFNHSMTEITGYTLEEANRAGDFSQLLYPDPGDHQKALDGLRVIIERPGPLVSETTITTKSGSRKPVLVSSQMISRLGRRMFLTTYADITRQKSMEKSLRESEEKFHLVFENAQDGMNIFEEAADHTKRRLVECNPRYAELAGRSRQELIARGSTSGLAVSLSEENVESIEGGVAFRGSFSWIRPDGRENFIEYAAMPIEMQGKKFTIGIDRDVTEARKTEELVRESQRRYRQLFEASPVPLMVYDAESLAILEVNPATIEHYGFSREEFLTMTVKDISPEEDVSRILPYSGNNPGRGEQSGLWRHRKKDGSSIQVEIRSHLIDWKGHRAKLVMVHDITDRLHAEEELKLQKAHFERLFESAPEGIALLDAKGDVHDVNKAFEQMFGFLKAEVVGCNIFDTTIRESEKEEALNSLEAVMGGMSIFIETQRTRRDGQKMDVSIIAVPVDESHGEKMAYVLYRDITQKKKEEREREALIDQLQKALSDVKTLGGLLPICAWCKKIRDDQGYFHQIEAFITNHSAAKFTHGICPDCRAKLDQEAREEIKRRGGDVPS
jgi:PAS domain S-box-containing protein